MRAYHVYIFNGTPPGRDEVFGHRLELITHIYSCLNHRIVNPDIPLTLITDRRTKAYYESLNITALYDEVITDIHDDYPRNRIASTFWASPKIWAMSKLQAPFVIFDTDLVLHKPLSSFVDCDLLYLHRETSAVYPNIFDVVGPPGFIWDDAMAWSFRNTQPMNCAVVGMFNEDFKSDYVRRYFEFVLDSSGAVLFATEASRESYPWSSAQIVAEQWLLAAVADYWASFIGVPIKTRAICKAIWTSECFFPFDMDRCSDEISAEIASTFYHLWGAKALQGEVKSTEYLRVVKILQSGRYIAESSPHFGAVRELFNTLLPPRGGGLNYEALVFTSRYRRYRVKLFDFSQIQRINHIQRGR